MLFVINEEYWQVELVAPNDEALWMPKGEFALGACNDGDKTIYISWALDLDSFWKVLAHEITHAEMFSHNIYLDYETEEIVAEIVSMFGEEIIDITNEIFRRIMG